jgi:hypothetical protein
MRFPALEPPLFDYGRVDVPVIVDRTPTKISFVAGLEPPGRSGESGIEIVMPILRVDQAAIVRDPARYKVIRCGRRYGKTVLLEYLAIDALSRGLRVAIFVPQYATSKESYENIAAALDPLIKNQHAGKFLRTTNGGVLDIWSMETGGLHGRGRKYDLILVDEAAFIKSDMNHLWTTSIKPTLATMPNHRVYVFSTPAPNSDMGNWFYSLHFGTDYQFESNDSGFKQFYRPSHVNPLVSQEFLLDEQRRTHALSFKQEYLALFTDWSGQALFSFDAPCDEPSRLTTVFAVMDSAMKGGGNHDGTAVMFFGYRKFVMPGQPQLVVLDWDIYQLDAVVIKGMFPGIIQKAIDLSEKHGAIQGFQGLYVENASSGPILIQEAKLAGMPVHAITPKYTSVGKDPRAMAIVNEIWNVGWAPSAFFKTSLFKGETVNHALRQVTKYRLGDPEANKRADDAADCFFYGVILALKPKAFD